MDANQGDGKGSIAQPEELVAMLELQEMTDAANAQLTQAGRLRLSIHAKRT